MKNKLIYLISVLFVAVACFSCSDDDDDNNDKDLIGTWNYSRKRLIFILNLTIMAKSVFPKE
ncbi:MAG: hypothetical protein V8R91_13575 [Butyricimonas faecihominis]